jgi:hypothetical protein
MLYLALGLGTLSMRLYATFRRERLPLWVIAPPRAENQPETGARRSPLGRGTLPGIALAILLFGSLLPIGEKIVPNRYPDEQLAARLQDILQSPELSPREQGILTTWQNAGGVVVQGEALYPRFYTANHGKPGEHSPDYARVDFYSVGPFNGGVVLAQTNAPDQFPNGADVVVFGCLRGWRTIDAVAVAVYNDAGNRIALLLRDSFPTTAGCPLPIAP